MTKYTSKERKKYAQVWALHWCKYHNYAHDTTDDDFAFLRFVHNVRDWNSRGREILKGKADYVVRLGELMSV